MASSFAKWRVAAIQGLTALPFCLSPASGDPLKLYGEEILFSVYRDGSEVGFHRTRFARDGGELLVDSRFELKIRILFVTAYRYSYESHARWRDGKLHRLSALVDDDGNTRRLEAAWHKDEMVIESTDTRETVTAPIFPTNHWNAAVLGQRQVLNTLTGAVNQVAITPHEETTITTERGPVRARRHRYTGDLEVDVWYDEAGRWVAMRFEGKDGSTIEYRCEFCQGRAGGRE